MRSSVARSDTVLTMPKCPTCLRSLMRTHRTPWQKLRGAEAFRCRKCGYRTSRWRPALGVALQFVFSRHSHCVSCGTERVKRIAKRDRVDSMSRNIVSILFGLTGAPLNKCPACRLQYRDWRRPLRQRAAT